MDIDLLPIATMARDSTYTTYTVADTVTFPADTWTVDRGEVLNGTGSVINGISALGTTINYVPKNPGFDCPDFQAMVAVGNFGMQRIAGGRRRDF